MGPIISKKGLLMLILAIVCTQAHGASNGNLQIHYINVGQGDGAILISPEGQKVMFDNGPAAKCTRTISYLKAIGVQAIDYHILSHYHLDHFGCSKRLFATIKIATAAYDRGVDFKSDSVKSLKRPDPKGYYAKYIKSVGDKRVEAVEGDEITLDAESAHPVKIRFVAMTGYGINTTNENDLSLVAHVQFGNFRTAFGGDLSATKPVHTWTSKLM